MFYQPDELECCSCGKHVPYSDAVRTEGGNDYCEPCAREYTYERHVGDECFVYDMED